MAQDIDLTRWFRRGAGAAAGVLMVSLAGFLAAAGAFAADPGASDWVRTDQTAVRLVSATAAVGTADPLRAGLQFTLKPGWKT